MNMTTKLLLWLILVILLGWLWFGPWYCCWQQWLCPDCVKGAGTEEQIGTTGEGEQEALAMHAPIEFLWNDAEAHTYAGWDSLKSSLVAGMADNKVLEITGLYWEGEEAPDTFATMGFARAAAVRDLLSKVIPVGQMELKSQRQDGAVDQASPLEAVSFRWKEVVVEEEAPAEPAVEEISTERVLFRFATNSANPRNVDADIKAYLDKVAERVKKTGEKIVLIGHTDNVGNDKLNDRLGRKRAEAVRKMLRKRGVPSAQIEVRSMGSKDPVASNSTEAGRAENRRVELKIEQ